MLCTHSTPQSQGQVLVLLGNTPLVFMPTLSPSTRPSGKSLPAATRCSFLPSCSCLGRRRTPTLLCSPPCFSPVLPGVAGRLTGACVDLGCWKATLNPSTWGTLSTLLLPSSPRRRDKPGKKGLGWGWGVGWGVAGHWHLVRKRPLAHSVHLLFLQVCLPQLPGQKSSLQLSLKPGFTPPAPLRAPFLHLSFLAR